MKLNVVDNIFRLFRQKKSYTQWKQIRIAKQDFKWYALPLGKAGLGSCK